MYKIIKEGKVIDVIKCADFIRFLPGGQVIRTSEDLAEGIIGSDYQTIYSFGSTINTKAIVITLEKVSTEEFNRLQSLLNSKQDISVDEQALAQAKENVVKSLSDTCKNEIIAGFSVKLLDGKIYSFKLTTEDQLNLLSIENQLNTGAKVFVYHATGLPCRVFTRDDMVKIIKAYRAHVLYHTTYFNAAKQYISSLVSIDKINSFSYGTNIAGIVKDPTLHKILQDGGA